MKIVSLAFPGFDIMRILVVHFLVAVIVAMAGNFQLSLHFLCIFVHAYKYTPNRHKI